MPVLSNLKWERFANHLVKGKTQPEAYKLSGYRGKYPDKAASAIAQNPGVKARVDELKARIERRSTAQAIDATAITKEVIMRALWENAEAGKSIRGGSAVRNRALELIGKEIGMFVDREAAKAPALEDLSTADLERLLGPVDAVPEAPVVPEPEDVRSIQ